eukprot:350168-Chlamydomonas_euryale.AAC.6
MSQRLLGRVAHQHGYPVLVGWWRSVDVCAGGGLAANGTAHNGRLCACLCAQTCTHICRFAYARTSMHARMHATAHAHAYALNAEPTAASGSAQHDLDRPGRTKSPLYPQRCAHARTHVYAHVHTHACTRANLHASSSGRMSCHARTCAHARTPGAHLLRQPRLVFGRCERACAAIRRQQVQQQLHQLVRWQQVWRREQRHAVLVVLVVRQRHTRPHGTVLRGG